METSNCTLGTEEFSLIPLRPLMPVDGDARIWILTWPKTLQTPSDISIIGTASLARTLWVLYEHLGEQEMFEWHKVSRLANNWVYSEPVLQL